MPSPRVSRRNFLTGATVLVATSLIGKALDRSTAEASTDLLELSATEAVAMLRRGDVKAEDYAAALLARCDAGKQLNAFISIAPDQVKEAARAADRRRAAGAFLGPLHGLPIPIKDSVNTRDYPTTSGTAALRSFRPKDDAPVVRALRDAGGIVLGKTNLHELSFGWTSTNLSFGAVKNPYDPTRIPGGSSGGTAVAVATRMAPLGVAEDTAGSIRVPAAGPARRAPRRLAFALLRRPRSGGRAGGRGGAQEAPRRRRGVGRGGRSRRHQARHRGKLADHPARGPSDDPAVSGGVRDGCDLGSALRKRR